MESLLKKLEAKLQGGSGSITESIGVAQIDRLVLSMIENPRTQSKLDALVVDNEGDVAVFWEKFGIGLKMVLVQSLVDAGVDMSSLGDKMGREFKAQARNV